MIKFGPSGNSESFFAAGYSHTEEAASYVKDMGLDCFEYSFGRGVRMGEEKARSIGKAFADEGVELSVHAPYFINFANPDDEMAAKSYGYVLDSGKMCRAMGGRRIVFDYIYLNGMQDMMFCPETMGKFAQIGTPEEIARFCLVDEVFTPCIDFGHVNARGQGSLRTEADYRALLEGFLERLGYERMKHFHAHFSKIMYGAKGEIKHLTFADERYGPEFEPLAAVLKELRLEPYVVSESDGTQAEDALAMKRIYEGVPA